MIKTSKSFIPFSKYGLRNFPRRISEPTARELKEGITMYQSKEFRITNSFNGTIIIHPALSKCDYTLI